MQDGPFNDTQAITLRLALYTLCFLLAFKGEFAFLPSGVRVLQLPHFSQVCVWAGVDQWEP